MDTGLIERERALLAPPAGPVPAAAWAAAALWLLHQERLQGRAEPSPWGAGDAWRLNGPGRRSLSLAADASPVPVEVEYAGAGWQLRVPGFSGPAAVRHAAGPRLSLVLGDATFAAEVFARAQELQVFVGGGHFRLVHQDPLAHAGEAPEAPGGLTAPMPGKIVALLVPPGSAVDKAAPLLVMEAMKMEHTLLAPAAGTVKAFLCAAGEQVREGAALVEFEAGASPRPQA
jgi:3-methylcrotonyl-CoA carboxylase alpha subunit